MSLNTVHEAFRNHDLANGKAAVLECGMKLYQVVDGKPVLCDEETTKRHLDEMAKLTPEERMRAGDAGPHWVPESYQPEAD